MEKIVTKIGDVTIERKVSKISLQKFSVDATHRGILPQSAARSTLDDLVKSLPQSEVLKIDNLPPQHGVNARAGKPLNALTQMGKSFDIQSEMEQKLTVPKGISWDSRSSENSRQRTGNWNQLDSRTGAKNQFNNTSQNLKRMDQIGTIQADMSRFGGISIERKRARVPENEPGVGRLSSNNRFSSGSSAPGTEVFNIDQTNFHGKGFSYPDIERLTQGGLTIEKKTNCQADPKLFRANSQNSINANARRFQGNIALSSKSPIHVSSDEDKGPAEEYNMKDVDFEEDYDNETEDDDEEEISKQSRFFNRENAVHLQAERESNKQEIHSGSPIVLSSEDDEKNDEDVMVMDESRLLNLNSRSGNLSVKSKSSDSIVIDDLRDSSVENSDLKVVSQIKVSETSRLGCSEPKSEAEILSSDVELDSDDVKALDDSNELGEELSEMEEEEQMKENDSEGLKLKEENDQSSPEDEADEPKNSQEDEESELKSSETELPPSDGSEAGDEKTKTDDVANDIVCDDLMELMKKGEIEGEVEDEKEYEIEEEGNDKRGEKRKAEVDEASGEKAEAKTKSKKKKSEKSEEGESKEDDDKNIDKSKVTSANLRKNIREVMDETKLDEATLSAQRQEAERLKRLQDQQKIIRELQKQIVLNRQNQKFQGRVMSLLQGNSQTSILKTSSTSRAPQSTSHSKSSNHVLVKLSNGQQTSLNNKKMIELLKNAKNKVTLTKPTIPKTLLKQGMVSPSVSIAPIAKKEAPVDDKKKKKGDIVTLSSDSEDDCIVLSEEDESEPEEDPTNSGMHTSDKYNVPDDQGRVIVNVGHPESESDIYLAPQIARIIKPHQIGGIRFLYDNVIESLERFQSSTGFGCILAHSMGLGKTLQIVSFSDIFLRYTSAKTILCIMPINTIQNWLAEFNIWLPKESNSTQEVRCRDFDLYIVNESLKNINSRSKVILDWHKNGGVLLMGYELFRLLSLKKSNKSKKKKKDTDEKEDEAKNKELMEEVYAALVRPGPDLVICDEGHRIKNSHATTSQALKQIRTKRRIVLTGYPLQNNLLEYWCMVDFVRPNYLGSKTEFSNMFERPIQNGQCIDSTPQDKRLMRYRAHVLHSLLEGFVQRRSHAVLQSTLPEKEEYVLLLRFTPFQRKLYDTFMNEVVRTVAVPNPLKAFAVCCKIWNHPDVLYNFLKKKGEEIDLDLEEALPPSMQQPSNYPFGQTPPDGTRQFPPSQMVQPWPKRGPGSRGGKIRPCALNRRPGRGRKPAATVSPNLTTEKKDQEPENFNPGNYPPNYPDFQHQNSTESMMDNRNRNFGRGYNQYQSSDYGNHSNFSGSSYDSKNPLENLEDLSSGDFQNKRYYPQQTETGLQNSFSNPSCMQQNANYPQNVSQSNSTDMNSGFNRSNSSKPFQYNQNYNSGYYPGGNYQAQKNTDFEQSNKQPDFNRNNQSTDQYYQNTQYSDGRDSSINYNMQASNNMDYQYSGGNSDQNYQQRNLNKHYQNSTSGYSDSSCNANYQSSRSTDPNYPSDFQGSKFSNSSVFNQTNQERDSAFNKQQEYWSGSNWFDANKNNGDSNYNREKFGMFEGDKDVKKLASDNHEPKSNTGFGVRVKSETELERSFGRFEDDKGSKAKDKGKKEEECKMEKKDELKSVEVSTKKEDSLPYDWATDLFKNYVTGIIENSSKMEVFFHILSESIKLGDRLLVFSQSLLTLDLIEDYLHRYNVPNKDEKWAKNRNYFRLDGSTPGLEREKLINEFNSNPNVFIFLVSTRAGSLGINLVGANRVVVFDASWNPCHDTQAVCRVYRYGQQKPCFVYRLVMDSCLEKKIYDRQINKQGMADRVVDELNPDAHLSIKEVTNLCWDDQEDTTVKDFSYLKDKYNDQIIKVLIENCSKLLSKEPFQHESLLIDRKEKKLSQAEKRLAKRSYELEKQAANQPKNIYSFFPNAGGPRNFGKPIASVRPMQNEMATRIPPMANRSKWIPAEVWQKQGMSAQEMTLPLDVVIPTNSPEKTSIVLKAGQRVMVLKSPKGIYMQLENGKIIAIRTAFKVGQGNASSQSKGDDMKKDGSASISTSLKNNPNVTITSKQSNSKIVNTKPPFVRAPEKKLPLNFTAARSKQLLGKTKPLLLNRKFQTVTPEIRQRLMANKPKFDNQEEKTASSSEKDDVIVTSDTNESFKPLQDGDNRVVDDQSMGKGESSLETLRKVTENIRDKPEGNNESSQVQMNLKNFRHNFSSQLENKTQDSDDEKEVKMVEEVNSAKTGDVSFNGNENVQNWLMNQSYPAMDPYSNYFPSYYAYGHGGGGVANAYEGYYPNNYVMGNKEAQAENSKTVPYQQSRTGVNQNMQQSRNPVYPPYSNPYQQYSHNYPNNPGYNNQGYQFPQNQQQVSSNPGNTSNSSQQSQSYDNSMYSAFHRPDGHYQGSDNSYSTPYRPPYSGNSSPGFFPYNTPYRPYPDTNYHYNPNFNPYMHPPGYGYPHQNPTNNNRNPSFNQHSAEPATNTS